MAPCQKYQHVANSRALKDHLLGIISGRACQCNDFCNVRPRWKVVVLGRDFLPKPRQKEAGAVPADQ